MALKHWIWLAQLPGVGSQLKLRLLNQFGDPDRIYYADGGEYLLVEGMTRAAAAALEEKSLADVDKILGDCEKLGLRIITLQDSEYPDRLRNIYDPPLLLYVQGRMPLFDDEVAIAIVGTRKASPYALNMGERLGYDMARMGAVVVSGLAAGGDAAAHRGALRAGGLTAAVIGGGHDVIYPRENWQLYEDIAVRGVILSEYPPGTEHKGAHFPARNRIISGLSLGLVVTEAPEKSGTLITAARALEQGRDVFAVPGLATDCRCTGSNHLLRDGAGVVTESWDVLGCYAAQYPHKLRQIWVEQARSFGAAGAEPEEGKPTAAQETREEIPPMPVLRLSDDHGLTDDQVRIVRALEGRTLQVDELIEETQIPTRRVLSALTILELDRIVAQSSGKRFALAVTLQ